MHGWKSKAKEDVCWPLKHHEFSVALKVFEWIDDPSKGSIGGILNQDGIDSSNILLKKVGAH